MKTIRLHWEMGSRMAIIFTMMPILMSLNACQDSNKNNSLNIISYNIRFDNPADGVNAWPNRKDYVAALLRFYDADVVCLQEALHHQLTDLVKRNPHYTSSGVGRDDGQQQGEYAAILFDNNKLQLMDSGDFWLSATPEKPSMGWDAACIRICSWVALKDIQTSKQFFVFNAHFDHVGDTARMESARLIVQKINQIAGSSPVILGGDFNTQPSSPAIEIILESLSDSYCISREKPYGPHGTWNAFDYLSSLDNRIDYIFVNQHFIVEKHAHLTDAMNSNFLSDHLPVFARVSFK